MLPRELVRRQVDEKEAQAAQLVVQRLFDGLVNALPQTLWRHGAVAALPDAHTHERGGLERPIWRLFVLAAWFGEIDGTKSHASSA